MANKIEGAEINAMPLNIYDQLNQKLKGNLELKPCGDVKVIGYSIQLKLLEESV